MGGPPAHLVSPGRIAAPRSAKQRPARLEASRGNASACLSATSGPGVFESALARARETKAAAGSSTATQRGRDQRKVGSYTAGLPWQPVIDSSDSQLVDLFEQRSPSTGSGSAPSCSHRSVSRSPWLLPVDAMGRYHRDPELGGAQPPVSHSSSRAPVTPPVGVRGRGRLHRPLPVERREPRVGR